MHASLRNYIFRCESARLLADLLLRLGKRLLHGGRVLDEGADLALRELEGEVRPVFDRVAEHLVPPLNIRNRVKLLDLSRTLLST